MAAVTNRARAPRVLALADGRQATLAPGQTEDLDLAADHPVHAAWAAAGEIEIAAAPCGLDRPLGNGFISEQEEGAEPCPDPLPRPARSRQQKP